MPERWWPDPAPGGHGRAGPVEGAAARCARLPLAWCEQSYGEKHLFGRHATVEKGPPIAGLILPELGGIDKKPVPRRKQESRPRCSHRQAEARQVIHNDR